MARIDSFNGAAELAVGSVAGRSVVLGCRARSPIRLLTPGSRRHTVWAYTSSFGGGMVAGDRTSLKVRIDAGARCFLSSQSSTKIYRNPARLPCSHEMVAELGEDSLFVLVPEPVQCFADSVYEQRQRFEIAPTSNLVVVDWLSCGRAARGERWSFRRYLSRNDIVRGGKPVLIDPMLLDGGHGSLTGKYRGGRFNCMATICIHGPRLKSPASEILQQVAEQPIVPGADLVFAASPLGEGLLLRLAGVSVEQVARAIQSYLRFVPALIEDDPWARKR